MWPICTCTRLRQSLTQPSHAERDSGWGYSPGHCSLVGGALEVVNDDSSVPTSRRTKNSRSSWLRCSVASVVTGADVALPRTGARTAQWISEKFRTSPIRTGFTPSSHRHQQHRRSVRTQDGGDKSSADKKRSANPKPSSTAQSYETKHPASPEPSTTSG